MVLVELFFMLFVLFSGVRLIYGLVKKRFNVVKGTSVLMVIIIGIYFVILILVSIHSHNRLLSLGEVKHFSGFYLDSHLGAEVMDVKKTDTIDSLTNVKSAQNQDFYLVTLKITNNARRATLRLHDPIVEIMDEQGKRFRPQFIGKTLIHSPQNGIPQLALPVGPNDDSFTQDLVFEIPSSVQGLKLLVEEGDWFPEIFLIGDEKSLLHKKTYFQIEPHQT